MSGAITLDTLAAELAEVKRLLVDLIDQRHQNEKRAELDTIESLGSDALLSYLKSKSKEYDHAHKKIDVRKSNSTSSSSSLNGSNRRGRRTHHSTANNSSS